VVNQQDRAVEPHRPAGKQDAGGLDVLFRDPDPHSPPGDSEPVGRAFLDEPAMRDHRGPITGLLHLGKQVTGQEDRGACRGQARQQIPELADSGWVEAVRRLVDDQQRGRSEQGSRQSEALAHALRVGLDLLGPGIRQAGQVEHPANFGPVGPTSRRGCQHLQVRAAGHPRVERRLLDHRARPGDRQRVGQRTAKQPGPPRRRADQPEQHPDGRCLASAIRPEEAVYLAGGHPQVQAIHRDGIAEPLGQPLAPDRIHNRSR
jgi:hypothetical protein